MTNTEYSKQTKLLILQDYLNSKSGNLGEFAFREMKKYDDFSYELVLINAYNDKGHRVTGHAVAPTKAQIRELIKLNGLTGEFHIKEIDCQKEFFCLLSEIRDDLRATGMKEP
jgi:hypothetical protein